MGARHLLTRRKACFHSFAAHSHTPQGAFSSFMHKRTFALSLAPSGAFSFALAPRGAAAKWMAEAAAFIIEARDFSPVLALALHFPIATCQLALVIPENEILPCGQDEIHAQHGRYPRFARTKSAGCACRRRNPETFSVSGLHLPWQLSTLAGPVVRLPSTC